MMTLKGLKSLVVLVLVVSFVLAGCSSPVKEPTAVPEEIEVEEEPVEEAADEAAEEPVEEPAEEVAEEPTEEPVEEPVVEPASEIKNPGIFIMLHKADVISLDPAWYFDGASLQPVVKLYEKLIVFKGDSVTEYEPIIASEIPTEENGLVFTDAEGSVVYSFPIRQDVKFHSGDMLTPEDVKYSFMRFMFMDRSGGGAYVFMPAITGFSHIADLAVSLAGVESFEQVDEAGLVATFDYLDQRIVVNGNNVEFHLPKPYAPFMSVLAGSWPDHIVSKSWTIEQGGWPGTAETWSDYYDLAAGDTALYDVANGTGPFKFVGWDQTNKEVTLERFDEYWGGPVALDKVIIRHVPEWSTRKLMLEAGDADWIDSDYAVLEQVEGMPGINVIGGLGTSYDRVLHFNWNVMGENNTALGSGQIDGAGIPADFFSDVDVRKGFCYAFDYDTYLQDVWGGQARQSTGPILEGQLGFDPDKGGYSLNLAKAEEHFRQAYDGELWEKGFEFKAFYPDRYGETGKAAMDILAEGLLTINPNFKMNIEVVQWSTFLGNIFGEMNMPLFMLDMGADFADTDNVVSLYMASDYMMVPYSGANFIALAEQEFDPLIIQARESLDAGERKAIYASLQQLAYDYAINVFLEQGIEEYVVRDWVQGLTWNTFGQRHWSLIGVSKGY